MQPFGVQNITVRVCVAKSEYSSNTQVCGKSHKSFYSSNSKLLWKKSFDNRILNTMDSKIETIMEVLNGAEVSPVDSARYIRNILDAKPINSSLTDVQFISKVIETGLNNIRLKEMSFSDGFALYLKSKQHLRPDSIRDIRCMGNRLIKANPELAKRNFSELRASDCEEWLNQSFTTDCQHNKARSMLHNLFSFAIKRDWCDNNPIDKIERRRVVERQINPLTLSQTKKLIKTAQRESSECAVATALLVYAGIRPREVRRLTWSDIDIQESTITIRSQCSKTGGVRHVEIPPVLNRFLTVRKSTSEKVCPVSWSYRWRKIRDNSGFRGRWVQDVLRHTYASFHTKHYADLPRLQLNMGHRDIALLRSRYVNMHGISKADAKKFFL